MNITTRALRSGLVLCLASGLFGASEAHASAAQTPPAMVDLGTLGQPHSAALSVSADGSVAVGWSGVTPTGGVASPTLWDETGAPVLIPVPQQPDTVATAISSDGTTVVGTPTAQFEIEGFRWSRGAPSATTITFKCASVSADGSVVGGKADDAMGGFGPALWTAPGAYQFFSTTPGVGFIQALSADGLRLVGTPAFRYDLATGTLISLGSLGGNFAEANACSSDAEVIVGRALLATLPRERAFRWTSATGMVNLGTLGGVDSRAYGVSRDGSVVVGSARDGAGRWRAFRWTQASGMQDLGTLGGAESHAYAVSADGSVIVGSAQLPSGQWHAFRQVVPGEVGTRYCTANANSTGSAAQISIAGSPVVAEMNFSLIATGLPPSSLGLFIVSSTQGFVVAPGGSQGNLCLGGFIGRLLGPGQVQLSSSAGALRIPLQPLAFPLMPGVVGQPSVGSLWHFQAWYRDANPGNTSNFTDAVSVTMQ